jgi:hypothetical protein
MRGADAYNEALFTTIRLEEFVPANHPLRPIRTWVNEALAKMDAKFSAMYEADIKGGRPSIAPEKLMRAMLLQVLYSVRSERQLVEQIQYNLGGRLRSTHVLALKLTILTYVVAGPADWDDRWRDRRNERASLNGWLQSDTLQVLAHLPWIRTPAHSPQSRLVRELLGPTRREIEFTVEADREASMVERVRRGLGLCMRIWLQRQPRAGKSPSGHGSANSALCRSSIRPRLPKRQSSARCSKRCARSGNLKHRRRHRTRRPQCRAAVTLARFRPRAGADRRRADVAFLHQGPQASLRSAPWRSSPFPRRLHRRLPNA